jgi:hypothetical protein
LLLRGVGAASCAGPPAAGVKGGVWDEPARATCAGLLARRVELCSLRAGLRVGAATTTGGRMPETASVESPDRPMTGVVANEARNTRKPGRATKTGECRISAATPVLCCRVVLVDMTSPRLSNAECGRRFGLWCFPVGRCFPRSLRCQATARRMKLPALAIVDRWLPLARAQSRRVEDAQMRDKLCRACD